MIGLVPARRDSSRRRPRGRSRRRSRRTGRGAVSEEAFVERVVVDAHVTAPNGTPIPDLTPPTSRRVDR